MSHVLTGAAVGLAVGLSLTGPAEADEETFTFGCAPGWAFNHQVREHIDEMFDHQMGQYFAARTMTIWDAAAIRNACERRLAGETDVYVGCMDGRRDWDEIRDMIPNQYWAMSQEDFVELRSNTPRRVPEYAEAIEFCESNGIEPGFGD